MNERPICVRKCVIEKPDDEAVHPFQRSGHCCAADSSNLYIFGGYHPEFTISEPGFLSITMYHEIFRDLWRFNFASRRWHKMETTGVAPTETASMSMLLSGNTLILFGGTLHPWGAKSNDQVYTLNLNERKWRILRCEGTIPGKYGQAMVLHEDALYVFGGCRRITEEDHLFDSELYHLNMRTHEWSLILGGNSRNGQNSSLANANARGMYRHGLVYYEDKLYVIGSSWEEIWNIHYFSSIHVFDLTKEKWTQEKTLPTVDDEMPQRRAYHSCVHWGSEVYICGGHDHQRVLDDIWCLHLPDLRWRKIHASLPVTSFFHSAAITDTKCMYLFGGVRDLEDRVRTSFIQRVWLDIPPLTELCWQQLLAQCPAMVDWSRDELIRLGIPRILTERLKPIR